METVTSCYITIDGDLVVNTDGGTECVRIYKGMKIEDAAYELQRLAGKLSLIATRRSLEKTASAMDNLNEKE